ncbi:MAG: DUF1786 domain-containing protein [Deltaproteobacteria bacterium]|nr:MAG: DUF1786 domain-containing protein [Deltaproteobacteria bacterium]
MVLPSQTTVVAARIRQCTRQGVPIFLTGNLMGGGACVGAIQEHLKRGYSVYAETQAALTIYDNLDRVAAMGVTLVEEPPPEAHPQVMKDVDRDALARAFGAFEVQLPEVYAVAVQDHGFSPHGSNRLFRFQQWRDFLARGGRLDQLWYWDPPAYLTRMLAVQRDLPGALVMDTGAAAILGALCDPLAEAKSQEGLVVLNLGNQHAVAALVLHSRIVGIYEHHTGCLSPSKLHDQLLRFRHGSLTDQEMFEDQGHGCVVVPEVADMSSFSTVVVTGPQRHLAKDLGYYFAVPYGDMMLSGCFGLIRAAMGMIERHGNEKGKQ